MQRAKGITNLIFCISLSNREGAKNSGGKKAGLVPAFWLQVDRRYLPALAPLSLTSQVPDQRIFTGATPEWSVSEAPVVKVTGGTPVIN